MLENRRRNATANTNRNTGAERFRVRELRPDGWHPDASEASHQAENKAEAEQTKGLAFSLSAPLAFGSLPLLASARQFVPRQATTSNLSADVLKAIRVRQLAPVVAEALFIEIAKQVIRLYADVGAVQLTLHSKLSRGLILHRFTNTVKHEPRGFLSHAKVTRDLIRADTVAAVGNQPDRGQPLIKADRRFVKERADLHRELFAACGSFALPNAARLKEHRFLGSTVRALNPVRPTLRREVLQRVVRIGEVNDCFSQCFRGVHEQIMH